MTTLQQEISAIKEKMPEIKQKAITDANLLVKWVKNNPFKAVFILGFIVGFILGTII